MNLDPHDYNQGMAIDKELYRKVREALREWNQAELAEHVYSAGKHTPQETFRQYVDLWEFAMRISAEPNDVLQRLEMEEWNRYYDRLLKFEAWRRQRAERA